MFLIDYNFMHNRFWYCSSHIIQVIDMVHTTSIIMSVGETIKAMKFHKFLRNIDFKFFTFLEVFFTISWLQYNEINEQTFMNMSLN